jgi:hypothetical protein
MVEMRIRYVKVVEYLGRLPHPAVLLADPSGTGEADQDVRYDIPGSFQQRLGHVWRQE